MSPGWSPALSLLLMGAGQRVSFKATPTKHKKRGAVKAPLFLNFLHTGL